METFTWNRRSRPLLPLDALFDIAAGKGVILVLTGVPLVSPLSTGSILAPLPARWVTGMVSWASLLTAAERMGSPPSPFTSPKRRPPNGRVMPS